MSNFILPSSSSHLNFRQRLPAKHLLPWVQCLWSTDGHQTLSQPRTEKLYPDAGSSLTIKLSRTQPSITYNFNKNTLFETFSGTERCLSIRFKAAGAYYLLGLEPLQFADHNYQLGIDFKPLWFDSFTRVIERLYQINTEQGLALLEVWLLDMLQRQPLINTQTHKIILAIERLPFSTMSFIESIGLTRRTLERKLKREMGVSPGQLVSYARLHYARRLLADSDQPLAQIALQCGYYDQAHFTHAFQTLAYETPAAYRKRKLSQIYKA